jgi:hypothetical protein
MNLAVRRIALLASISAGVFGLSWLLLLVISRLFLSRTAPLALGTVLQASAGSFCFAYSIVQLRGRAEPPPLAQVLESVGIAAFGIGLWIIAGRYLILSTVALRTFALPSQMSMLIGGISLITARLLRRFQASKRYTGLVIVGNICVGALLIVLLIGAWYR